MSALERETFKTSRLLDFRSTRELVKQIGHPVDQWPLVVLKELVDNAIDAADDAAAAWSIAAQAPRRISNAQYIYHRTRRWLLAALINDEPAS